jgi:hypothetical protein
MKQIVHFVLLLFPVAGQLLAQTTTTCPAPVPGTPNCYQTSRPSGGNPLTNWPPIPNQDCCNAIIFCRPYNEIENGAIIPPGAPAGTLYPGCVDQELPPDANTCFSNNEKGTTWYKFQIRPLGQPGSSSTPGSPAGKLRFKIIPKDVAGVPGYDQFTDNGQPSYGNTDYDFLLFKIPASASTDGAACTHIRNSTAFGTNASVIASCNWTGTRGPTGLFEPGTGTESAQGPATRFNLPLNVNVGDVFYLAIDNFSINDQGFDVDFRGLEAPDEFTAIVNAPPTDSIKIAKVINPVCAERQFKIIFDRPVRCDSVRPDKFSVTGLLPNLSVLSIQPEGGCNPGGQDTAFVFTLNMPDFTYDTTLQLSITEEIRDICGNKVLLETARLRLEYPVPLQMESITQINDLNLYSFKLKFSDKVLCDSVYPAKFQVIISGQPNCTITSISPVNCTAGVDSIYLLNINCIPVGAQLKIIGTIRNECGNPVSITELLPFPTSFFLQHPIDENVVINSSTKFFIKTTDPTVPRRWQVQPAGSSGFVDLEDGVGVFSGVFTDTLLLSSTLLDFDNFSFRCSFLPAGLPPFYSLPGLLNVIPEPFVILQQPSIQTVNLGDAALFTIKTSDPSVPRKWQRNSGFGGWTDLTDGGNYSGTATDSLVIQNALASLNNNLFRCRFSPPEYPEQFSNTATLFVPNQVLLKNSPLRIFPNPATGNSLQLSGRAQAFRLTNLLGQTEISRREINGEDSIDIRHLPDGVYFVTIEDAGRRWVSKLVVQR